MQRHLPILLAPHLNYTTPMEQREQPAQQAWGQVYIKASRKALQALKKYTEPGVTVIRNGIPKNIPSEDLVPGDIIILEEGNKVPADATVLQVNDLSVNESIVTGESLPVEKHEQAGSNLIYQGTTINTGKCYAVVTTTGNNTILGKLGKTIDTIVTSKTLLQNQVNHFVRQLAIFGILAFLNLSGAIGGIIDIELCVTPCFIDHIPKQWHLEQ